MKTRLAIGALAALCCVAWAAEDAALATQEAINPKLQAPSLEVDAVTIPRMLSYQGKLTDEFGNPVADTTYSVSFRLYTVPSGGSPFWNETQTVRTKGGLFSTLLGSVTPIGSMPDAGAVHLGMAVAGGAEMTLRLRIASAAYAYLTERAANADLLQGRDTTTFSRSTHNHDATYVNEGQADAVTSGMIVNGTIAAADLGQMGASSGQVMKWTGGAWEPRNDSISGSGGAGDNAWVRGTPDSVLFTVHRLGITRGEAGNVLQGTDIQTQTNFGVGCTTGGACAVVGGGQGNAAKRPWSVVAGGESNLADGWDAAVSGGSRNTATANGANVAGGAWNSASGGFAAASGGWKNAASGNYSSVAGGDSNVASGNEASVGGGRRNAAEANGAVVAGGERNFAMYDYTTVSGGQDNEATDNWAVVSGGRSNLASGEVSAVSGGENNNAGTSYDVVGGGQYNSTSGTYATIGGGYADTVAARFGGVLSGGCNRAGDVFTDSGAVVAGGLSNKALAEFSSVLGGFGNLASGRFAVVGGGRNDTASAAQATVGGGAFNVASAAQAAVGGGARNIASAPYATVAGGINNQADSIYATVAGGTANHAGGSAAFAGGGYDNFARGDYATIGGGERNRADGIHAFIGGGSLNGAAGELATVGGGTYNEATGATSTVSGGFGNDAGGIRATIGGGMWNLASGSFATVGGGLGNYAAGGFSTVAGGHECSARGYASLAGGDRAMANHSGCFVWSDSFGSPGDTLYTSGVNQWRVRARGGAWFYSDLEQTTGAYLAPGSNSWQSACDSATKEDFRPVDRKELLEKVAALKVRNYKMKDQNDGTRHIGPVAQDFYSAFGYGETEKGINTADADGVALAAIQALYEEMKTDKDRIAQLEAELAQLKKQQEE